MSRQDFDLAIVGAGFSGSLLAMIARRLGISVILLERGRHPRFVIGESSTPLANLLLDQLSVEFDLPRVRPLCQWGTWQANYPQVACGLKRGFAFFHHQRDRRYYPEPDHHNQLLVGASPNEQVADTHWYRPDFDYFLVCEAQRMGVEYLDQVFLDKPEFRPGCVSLSGKRNGGLVSVSARFLVDASGARGYLWSQLKLPESSQPYLPPTQALFSHFRGVGRLQDLGMVPPQSEPPFPLDDAAVHHVFDGGWIWVLRFNNGLTSAGLAACDRLAQELRLAEGAQAWARLLQQFPTIQEQFKSAETTVRYLHFPKLAFRTEPMVGPGWAMLPSAASFIDPLLSTGFTLTLLGVLRLSRILQSRWGGPAVEPALSLYSSQCTAESLATERLIAALYASMSDFARFANVAFLYFAAVSFSEVTARKGDRDLSRSFLLCDESPFGLEVERLLGEVLSSGESNRRLADRALKKRVLELIRPYDRIGLCRAQRPNWFPVS